MGSSWRKAKRALGLNLCVYVPPEDDPQPSDGSRLDNPTGAISSSSSLEYRVVMPTTPVPSSGELLLAKSGSGRSSSSSSSKKTCAICLGSMKPGHGHALFTAECSHMFHFNCIVSNVKYGNRICPVCRSKWKEVPLLGATQSSDHSHSRSRVNPIIWPQDEAYMTIVRSLSSANSSNRQNHRTRSSHSAEPTVFNDDDPVSIQHDLVNGSQHDTMKSVELKTYAELPAVEQSVSKDNFTVLIHLKAPDSSTDLVNGRNVQTQLFASQSSRAHVDLITVLDVSGSMAGTKLALLKRAMGFVIQNLGPSDRLSIIAFSSTARRLFPLRRMSDEGRQQALQAVNALVSSGGTNIAEGLTKGAMVLEDRREKNLVASIILLSDGQDTYNINSSAGALRSEMDYRSFIPSSIRSGTGHQVPVHAFGFGADHDSISMHSISETSGGTFSFIEAEGVIQDAFAQCIGGLLSVVVQEVSIGVECIHPGVRLNWIKSGGYSNQIAENRVSASIDVGDLYAEEERDFLVTVNLPKADEETTLIRVRCNYRDPVLKEIVNVDMQEVRVQRPEIIVAPTMSIEVDRQRNRVLAAEAIAEARVAAERGELSQAVSVLENCRRTLAESGAAQSGDRLCIALGAELKEMEERMASRQRYEASGRAYVLSGLSSHSWQRATARGDSTDSASLVHAYQTPSMVDMLQRSQTFGITPPQRAPVRPSRSFKSQPGSTRK